MRVKRPPSQRLQQGEELDRRGVEPPGPGVDAEAEQAVHEAPPATAPVAQDQLERSGDGQVRGDALGSDAGGQRLLPRVEQEGRPGTRVESSPQFAVKTWGLTQSPGDVDAGSPAGSARAAFARRDDTLRGLRRLDLPAPAIGITVQSNSKSGWYADAAGQRHLVKLGPAHQLQAELFGAALWRLEGLPAPRCAPALLDGDAAVAVAEIPGARDVASSWFTPQQNVDNYRSLLTAHPEARAQLVRGFLLDVINGNLDGAQNVMQSADGAHFIDFGGTLDARPRGGVKKPHYFAKTLELDPYLRKLGEVIGEAHPAFAATRAELLAALEAMIDGGLRAHLDAALDHALRGMEEPARALRRDGLSEILQARVDALRAELTAEPSTATD